LFLLLYNDSPVDIENLGSNNNSKTRLSTVGEEDSEEWTKGNKENLGFREYYYSNCFKVKNKNGRYRNK